MKPVLVEYVDGEKEGLRYALAGPDGALYLAYRSEVLKVSSGEEATTVYSATKKRKADRLVDCDRFVMVAKWNEDIWVLCGNRVDIVREGKVARTIDGLFRHIYSTDSGMILLAGGAPYSMVYEHTAGTALALMLQQFPAFALQRGTMYQVGRSIVVTAERSIVSAVEAVETSAVSHALRTCEMSSVISLVSLSGDYYHIGGAVRSEKILYKNGKPLMGLPISARQLTADPSSGLYVVHGDRVSVVKENLRWSSSNHRWFDEDTRDAIKATIIILTRRWKIFLPAEMMSELFNWLVR